MESENSKISEDISLSKRDQATNLFGKCCALFPKVPAISTQEILDLQRNGRNYYLIDVRSDAERNIGMIPNAVTSEYFEKELKSKCNKDAILIPYCTIGYRSGAYGTKLVTEGFQNVRNGDGVVLWTYSGQPFVKGDGERKTSTFEVNTFGKKWDLAANNYTTTQLSLFEFASYLSYEAIKRIFSF